MSRAARHWRGRMYLNTLCFSPVGCRSWQSDTVDFLAGNILLGTLRAVLASLFSVQKKARSGRQPSRTASSSKGRGGDFRQPDSYNLASAAVILDRLL